MIPRPQPTRLFALGESLLVSLICASSFVLVKTALDDVGPLTLAGLRYFGAFIVLLPFMAFNRTSLRRISPPMWGKLLMIGLSAYTVGNGALFWSLKYLPATTGSFLMGLIPLLVLIAAVIWLKEVPARWQVVGAAICLAGNGLFFSQGLQGGEPLGMFIISIGLVSFAAFGILGRAVARGQEIDTLTLTAIPLALGGGVLLVIALPLEGLPNLTPVAIGIVLWLATINTALAYILYNHSL
jgi:drug/metabolite transporter (DMT)-like permease